MPLDYWIQLSTFLYFLDTLTDKFPPLKYTVSVLTAIFSITIGSLQYTAYGKMRFSTNILLFLGNNTTESHGYYGMRIGNGTQAFE